MSRVRLSLSLAVPMALLLALFTAAPAVAAETVLVADMSGDAEVPGPGDENGFGHAQVTIDPDAGTVCWSAFLEEVADPTAAHIHEGAEGEAGPPVVTFEPPLLENCVEGQDAATLQAIVDDPAAYYVNYHNADFPDGAVRGQLAVPPTTLFAQLTGETEVPGPGDPEAFGDAFMDFFVDEGRVCVGIFIGGAEDFTAAHIHEGAETEAGPPVVTLPTPDETGTAEGCVEDLDSALLQQIVDNPSNFYVNVHTAEFPDGAARGQLSTEPPAPPPAEDCTPPELCQGRVIPGDYTYSGFARDLTFVVDNRWRGRIFVDGFGLETLDGSGALYMFRFAGLVGGGTCGEEQVSLDTDAASLAAWLADHPALVTTGVTEVTHAGLPGLQVDADVDLPEECEVGEFPAYTLIYSPPIDTFWVAEPEHVRFIVQEVGGETVITIIDDFFDTGFDALLARLNTELTTMEWSVAGGPDDGDDDEGELPDTALGTPANPTLLGIALLSIAIGAAAVRRHETGVA